MTLDRYTGTAVCGVLRKLHNIRKAGTICFSSQMPNRRDKWPVVATVYEIYPAAKVIPAILSYFGYYRATPALSFVRNIKKGFQYKV